MASLALENCSIPFKKLVLEDFKNEEEIYKFFETNLNLIFPNFIFVAHKYRTYQEGNEIDTVAWCNYKKSFVLIEYKNKSKHEDPITQILGYRESLEVGDFYLLREFLKKRLDETGKEVGWRNIKEEKENLILMCVSPFNYFTNRQYVVAKANNIILVEFQKYESNVFLISCYFKNHLKLLKWDFSHIAIKSVVDHLIKVDNRIKTLEFIKKPDCYDYRSTKLTSGIILEKQPLIYKKELNDSELANFLEKLKVTETIADWISKITIHMSNSSFSFKRKLFLEGTWKGGVNYYLKNISLIDIKLKQKEIEVWLRVNKGFISDFTQEHNLEEKSWKSRWGKESKWKLYRIIDKRSHSEFYSLLDNYFKAVILVKNK